MNLTPYWPYIEFSLIILVLFTVIAILWNGSKKRKKQPRPESFSGWVVTIVKYILRILGVGLGTLFLLLLVVMIERDIYSVITETAPVPSEVEVPDFLSFEVEEVTFQSKDDLTMAGWHVPSQNGATIILLHGYGGNRTAMIWHAEQLVNAGYGILMYDERASGESEGGYRSYGWEDTRDVYGAIEYLSAQNAGEKIGIMGCSTGADIALYGAALYPELGAVWADGASSVRAQDMPTFKNFITPIFTASNYMLDWMYIVKLGIEPPAPLITALGNIAPRPAMLVGGGNPRPLLGSEEELFTLRYAKIAGDNAQTWIIPEATHCDGPFVRPDEYSTRMVEFFDSSLGVGNK